MPIFKEKNDKNIKYDKNKFITLDGKHTSFLKDFYENENIIIPGLEKKNKTLQKKLHDSVLSYEERIQIEENIVKNTKNMKKLKKNKINYFRDNSKLIFDYFENKKNIDQNNQTEENTNTNTNKKIQAFFNIEIKKDIDNNDLSSNNNCIMKYFANTDDSFIDVSKYQYNAEQCSDCNKGELIPYEDEGAIICTNCYKNFPYLIENEKPSYKDTPKEITSYGYKPINHFKEVLAQTQAKETTQIGDEMIEKIKLQIKKERLKLEEVSNEMMRKILRKLNYDSKFYEHIPFIKHKMGIKPIIMSRELEEDLYNDFNLLQVPYFKHCPNNRENFLNYNYVAYKLCERRGRSEFLPFFHMIKDRNKLIEHDSIWEKMCVDLGWKFISTF